MEKIKQSRGSNWFFLVFVALLTLSVFAAYDKYMVQEDYTVDILFDEEGILVDMELFEEDVVYDVNGEPLTVDEYWGE